jgi:site-specific DNA recombinase
VTRKGTERGGGPWDKTRLGYVLGNVIYLGRVNHKGTVYPGEHEAIVDEAVWQRVQKLLRRNGTAGGRATRNKYGALLRGLLWCGPCETAMVHSYTQKGDRRYRYYVCGRAQKQGWDTCPTRSVPAGEIEAFVVDRLRCIGADPKLQKEVLGKIRAERKNQLIGLDREWKGLEKGLKTWEAEVKRLVGRKSQTPTATARLAEVQEKTSAAWARLAEIQGQRTSLAEEGVDEKDLAAALETFTPIWDALSPKEQARAVQLLVERVAYDGEAQTLAITFRATGIKALAEEN